MKMYLQSFQSLLFSGRRSFSLLGLIAILGGIGACGQTENLQDSESTDRTSQASQAILTAAGIGQVNASGQAQKTFQDFPPADDSSIADRQQSFPSLTDLTAQEAEPTVAVFDPGQVSIGDRIAGVTLAALDAKPLTEDSDIYTGSARFEGRIILEGTYHPPYEPGEEEEYGRLWDEGPCLQVAPESAALLPKIQGDFRAPWLCFDNSEKAVELLPDSAPRANVKIAIDNYKIQHEIPDERLAFDAKGVHRARLLEVLEGGIADKYCVQWQDFQSAVHLGELRFRSPVPNLPERYQNGCVMAEHGAHTLNIYVLPEGRVPETLPIPPSMRDWEIFKVLPFGIVSDRPEALENEVLIVRYDSGLAAERIAKEKAWSEPHIYDEHSVVFRYLWLESQAIPVEEMVAILEETKDKWDKSQAGSENTCGERPSSITVSRNLEEREVHLPEYGLTFRVPGNLRVRGKVTSSEENEAGRYINFSIYDPVFDDYNLCFVRNQLGTDDDSSKASIFVNPANRNESWKIPCSPEEILEYNEKSSLEKKTLVEEDSLGREGATAFIDASLVGTFIESCFYTPRKIAKITVATRYLDEPTKPYDRSKILEQSFYFQLISSIEFSEDFSVSDRTPKNP